ncbi:WbqC family protein [Streptomyces turgidiscabies]|uniref:WbqC-like protein n=1 Tax=Streptomyces turgidiscabies (strain Car8) TaxID=698760 RepID=L7ET03_STRT8|nr:MULTISPECIES: WbqC family protein [Streptomyces]ELP61520.1 WbqC-like protein [Streptomyces turgidiscabies Car8]MDX3497283.1 WbqC family protein [Streptomyces turgidiscabies]GAQ68620.1 WbqC-like protein family protein [Streptomyces turgidiscabies]
MIYIEQPPFAPWLGFCEALLGCDTVVFYDDVQYTQGGWQNRNRIKTADGVAWLTVPVVRQSGQLIKGTQIAPSFDPDTLLRQIRLAYARTAYIDEALNVLRPALTSGHRYLADLNIDLITGLATALGSRARLLRTSQMKITVDGKTERLAQICAAAGERVLWAGSGTRGYLDTGELERHRLSVRWNEFADRHPQYAQAWPRQEFMAGLSVIDAVCALGWAGTAALLRTSFDAYFPHAESAA